MKKNPIHISKIYAIGSMLLLLSFLAYWNYNNYKLEKEEMLYDLSDQLQLSIGDYNDSIFVAIVQEIQEDSFKVTSNFFDKFPNSLNRDSTKTTFEEFGLKKDKGSSIQLRFEQFDDSIEIQTIEVKGKSDETSEHLTNKNISRWTKSGGLQTIIIEDSTYESNHHTEAVAFSSDSKELEKNIDYASSSIFSRRYNDNVKEKYEEKLIKMGLPSTFVLVDSSMDVDRRDNGNLVNDRFPSFWERNYQTQFSNYKGYILKKIYPSLLMSSSLFGLVCLSYFFLFRNWRKQEELITLKNDFISNMTHELKTPISTVAVALEALSKYGAAKDPKKISEYIDISKQELTRLNILVDKVLKMSTFDKSESILNLGAVNLKDLTESVLASMRIQFEKHNVKSLVEFADGEYLVSGDKVHLTNVMYNVIDNAIKYSNENAEIRIKLYQEGNQVVWRIEDKGIGIASQYQGKIFDRFFRVPQHDVHNVKGYGLGLNYVKDIIEKHGGKVEVTSIENVGTEFTIKLPA